MTTLDCFTRNNTPYGKLSDRACDWIIKEKILKWNGEAWVYISVPVTKNIGRLDEKGKPLPLKDSSCCYRSMLLDWVIKFMQYRYPEKSEAECVEAIISTGYDMRRAVPQFERYYHIVPRQSVQDFET